MPAHQRGGGRLGGGGGGSSSISGGGSSHLQPSGGRAARCRPVTRLQQQAVTDPISGTQQCALLVLGGDDAAQPEGLTLLPLQAADQLVR